ncbi:MAG: GNAT family N-acetyltransferase [Acidobacteria bacterium]|nr:GNAT family N-acetyltransferase [Acidobacteriota bacterium]MBI3424011.1 GNAT family N-acetyltransferase [Acidobacteriota bacterium]
MLKLTRTHSGNADFQALVRLLDQDLRERDGAEHAYYAQFNKIDQLQHVVMAYVNDEAVGCGAFKPYAGNSVEIKRMFVRPAWRGKRIAQTILTELEAWAGELETAACVLETGKRQPEAIRLYQRCGYEIMPNYGQYAGVENSVCMQKLLR